VVGVSCFLFFGVVAPISSASELALPRLSVVELSLSSRFVL